MHTVIVRAVCKSLGLEGAPFAHRTIGSVRRRVSQTAGDGWTWRVEGSAAAVKSLGAYETQGAGWVLDVDGKGWLIEVAIADIAPSQTWIRDFNRSQKKKAA